MHALFSRHWIAVKSFGGTGQYTIECRCEVPSPIDPESSDLKVIGDFLLFNRIKTGVFVFCLFVFLVC